jgi:hypothetical protein
MRNPETENEPKKNGGLLGGLIELVALFEMFTGLVAIGLVALCFVLFDSLHITDTTTQVLLVVAPFVVFGFLMWRKGIAR